MFDRSMFYDELKRNPALVTRLNTIVNGEVGRGAPLDKRIIQLETIFNRAAARGQTLEQVTQMYTGPGSKGYYPPDTFRNGAVRSQNEANAFNETVLKPVLSGSDRSTELLGFAATGNASAHVAENGKVGTARDPRPKYTRHAALGGETYVQEGKGGRTGFDDIDRLNRYASGGSIPRPPTDVPMTDATYRANQSPQAQMLRRDYPNYQSPQYADVEGGGSVPLPRGRPTAEQMAAPQKVVGEAPGRGFLNAMRQAFAPQQQGGALGDQMIAAMGPRGALMSTFRDPTTGQQYLQGGSGEEAMGVLRPIGQAAARPAPAPQRPAQGSPPDQSRAARVEPQRGPVPPSAALDLTGVTADEAQRSGGRPWMPFDPTTFDTTPIAQQGGTTGPLSVYDPIGLSPDMLTASGVPTGAPFDVKQFMVGQRAPRPTGTALVGPFPRAPEAAGLLAAPAPSPRPPQRPEISDASAAFSRGGNTLTPPYPPTTVDQQLSGLSPFGITPQQNAFASRTLLPFDQWPPLDFGSFNWAGPSSFSFGGWG